MKGTFLTCKVCGKTKAWGYPGRWKPFQHRDKTCKGKPEVTLQATGCRYAHNLSDWFSNVESRGYRVSNVMMDIEDWQWMKKIVWQGKVQDTSVWGARLILNGYIITRDEREETN